jgi:pimeloyl-ACP methyl ester carboxylesterase
LAERVLHTILISPVTPYQTINLFHGVKSSNKLLAKVALHCPTALQPILNLMARSLLKQPDCYFDQVYTHLCESDATALSEPEVTDNILTSLREAMSQGTTAFSNDLCLLSQDWGGDCSAIKQPISIWHGSLDQHVPIDLARQLHHSLTNSTLYEVEGHGHLLIYYRWREILQSIREKYQ